MFGKGFRKTSNVRAKRDTLYSVVCLTTELGEIQTEMRHGSKFFVFLSFLPLWMIKTIFLYVRLNLVHRQKPTLFLPAHDNVAVFAQGTLAHTVDKETVVHVHAHSACVSHVPLRS